ncbi:MAG: ATP-binding protein [Lysobacterales bacterium]
MTQTGPHRVLFVEDDPFDAELAMDRLRADGLVFESRLVDDEPGFMQALAEFRPEVVVCDFNLPGFSGEAALLKLRELSPLTPFIYLSGSIGESVAVDALRAGATDYILKHQPTRLPSAVRRALAEAGEHKARRQAEAELMRSQRFESLAVLAGSFSHDLRNVLQPVLMAARMIEDQAQQPELAKYGAMIRECSERGLQMISAILDFARGGKHHAFQRVHVMHLFDAVTMLLRPSVPRSVELVVSLEDPELSLPGNATELQQALLNLGLNAVQAMPKGGTLTIAAELLEPTADFFLPEEARALGKYLRLRVSDTGAGMDAATLEQLFQPFFTTKDGGTGLGLVSCQRIVANHGGVLRVESAPDVGTTFDLYLPSEASGDDALSFDPDCQGRDERILLVSDEAATLTLLGDALGLCGYLPITAQGSANALQTIRRVRNPAALVLDSELSMLGAEATLQALRADGLACPVLLLGDRPVPSATDLGYRLSKPVTVNSLLRALRDSLDSVAKRQQS